LSTRQAVTKTVLLTILALIAFAGNSVLCRLALGANTIDAAGFTSVRLLSGIVVLVAILKLSSRNEADKSNGSWKASTMLFLYAIAFSYAYISLDTGTGALVLFGAVQITIILVSLFSGNKMVVMEWVGVIVAFFGFVYLVLPDVTTPSLSGFVLMAVAGIAWGFYTLQGKGSHNALADTAYNFIRTIPFVAVLLLATFSSITFTAEGIFLAALSGAVTSGIGYAIWYSALGGLTVTQAAVVQLFVPVIAAFGGTVFSDEVISLRLAISSVLILGGILAVVLGRIYAMRNTNV